MPAYTLSERRQLQADGRTILDSIDNALQLRPDPTGTGVFLTASPLEPSASQTFQLGQWQHVERFLSAYRAEPWWMASKTGTDVRDVLPETQYLLMKLQNDRYGLLLPLIDPTFRSSLQGGADECLMIHCESGNSAHAQTPVTCLFFASGDNPFQLMAQAAASVCCELKTVRLRRDKEPPDILRQFGWCTWDAFYCNVSHEKILAGLQSFADCGVPPSFMILDDGWLSVSEAEKGMRQLAGFSANEQFPGGLRATISAAKEQFHITLFYVWHAMQGYWDGIDTACLPDYEAVETRKTYSEWVLHHAPQLCEAGPSRLIPPEKIRDFYRDFHQHLQQQGVDGLKVDNQSTLEALGGEYGGRVALMRAYREALEDSAARYFNGELINCMSCSNDAIYNSKHSVVTRSSSDYQPQSPESHGLHLATNAVNSYFLSEFVLPDWDMFQSGHAAGAYHAAARSICGGPVYVSDEPGKQDAEVLRKLVLSTGQVPCPEQPARPTLDCLFADPCRDDVLLKIFTMNRCGGVLGTFNCQFHEDRKKRHFIAGGVRPKDIEGIDGDDFALYSHRGEKLSRGKRTDRIAVWLAELGFEIITIMPIQQGFAPIGLIDTFNSGGTIRKITYHGDTCSVELLDGGSFLAWAEFEPQGVERDGTFTPFSYMQRAYTLRIDLPVGGPCCLDIRLRQSPKRQVTTKPAEPPLAHLATSGSRRLIFQIPNLKQNT